MKADISTPTRAYPPPIAGSGTQPTPASPPLHPHGNFWAGPAFLVDRHAPFLSRQKNRAREPPTSRKCFKGYIKLKKTDLRFP